ncbi:hypothetical protein [Vibrio splendidus]|uniref:hypothetical protein n=1 Tax=Vibrio splendidus TaxID=29497 RepID=UPI0003811485|nr:hypothetical protein [Vibrio splendidus]OED83364.1 hypothetical protein A144_16350 [Vibrio splendidus ZF-90]
MKNDANTNLPIDEDTSQTPEKKCEVTAKQHADLDNKMKAFIERQKEILSDGYKYSYNGRVVSREHSEK